MTQQSESVTAAALAEAFKPFADFMSAPLFAKLSDETQLSAGSPMARRQISCGDLRKLADVIARTPSQPAASGGVAELKAEIERLTDGGLHSTLSSTDGGAK